MSQSTDSVDLLGGYKPVDAKQALQPLYELFLKLFKAIIGVENNGKFLKMTQDYFQNNNPKSFMKCVKHGFNSIKVKVEAATYADNTVIDFRKLGNMIAKLGKSSGSQ